VNLSVVIPCFDEFERLPNALAGALPSLRERLPGLELILVDDGSDDGTAGLLHELARREPFIKPLILPRNQGKGRALAEGVALSLGARVLIADADFSAPIGELSRLEAALDRGADVAIGSRAKRGAREIDQPLHRVVMGKSFNLLVQSLFLPGIWDTQCGFKLFRGELARSLFAGLVTDGFAFDVEILWRARNRGCRIEEVPVRWLNSDSSRVLPLRHSSQMLRDLLRLRVRT